jgi:hypothetical protein
MEQQLKQIEKNFKQIRYITRKCNEIEPTCNDNDTLLLINKVKDADITGEILTYDDNDFFFFEVLLNIYQFDKVLKELNEIEIFYNLDTTDNYTEYIDTCYYENIEFLRKEKYFNMEELDIIRQNNGIDYDIDQKRDQDKNMSGYFRMPLNKTYLVEVYIQNKNNN